MWMIHNVWFIDKLFSQSLLSKRRRPCCFSLCSPKCCCWLLCLSISITAEEKFLLTLLPWLRCQLSNRKLISQTCLALAFDLKATWSTRPEELLWSSWQSSHWDELSGCIISSLNLPHSSSLCSAPFTFPSLPPSSPEDNSHTHYPLVGHQRWIFSRDKL